MRLPLLLCLSAAASACAGSAPAVEAPRPRPVAVRPPPRPPAPVAVVPEAVPAPPAAPRGTVASRSHYAEADVTEWILSNGATVVFKPLPTPSGGVIVQAFERAAPGGTARLTGSTRQPDALGGLFATPLFRASEADRPGGAGATYIVVGNARTADIEVAAAQTLVLGVGVVFSTDDSPPFAPQNAAVYRVAVPPDADAAVAVLVHVLGARARPQALGTDAIINIERDESSGTTTLYVTPGAASPVGLRVSPEELDAARRRVARLPAESPEFWASALAALYQTPGDIRPSRDPAFVADFPARAARVTERAVMDLAARFATSPATD